MATLGGGRLADHRQRQAARARKPSPNSRATRGAEDERLERVARIVLEPAQGGVPAPRPLVAHGAALRGRHLTATARLALPAAGGVRNHIGTTHQGSVT